MGKMVLYRSNSKKTSLTIGEKTYLSNIPGQISVPVGSLGDYMLAISHGNRDRISPRQWLYRNRKRLSKEVISLEKKTKEGRALLKKYKIRVK